MSARCLQSRHLFSFFSCLNCGGGGGSEGIVFGNKSNFFWIVVEQSDFFFLPPPRKMKMKGGEWSKQKIPRRRERVGSRFNKKEIALFLSSFLRINMAVTLSGSRFSGAFSSCDSDIIDGTSTLRSGVVGWFFYYFFRDSFFLERRLKNQEKEKRKVGRRREKETKSRVAMATIKRSFAKRHSESTLCRSFPVHTLLFPLLFFPLLVFV